MANHSTAQALSRMPEAFVSDTAIRRAVSQVVNKEKLRKLVSQLHARNLTDRPDAVVRRNRWHVVAGSFPGERIADRTSLENAPAEDGSILLGAGRGSAVGLPGLALRPRHRKGPVATDRPALPSRACGIRRVA